MESEVVNNLVNASVIKAGTELSVEYMNVRSFGIPAKSYGTFKVVHITNIKNNYYFTVYSLEESKSIVVSANQIKLIDGMELNRIISAFNLQQNGAKKPRKPRRKKEPALLELPVLPVINEKTLKN